VTPLYTCQRPDRTLASSVRLNPSGQRDRRADCVALHGRYFGATSVLLFDRFPFVPRRLSTETWSTRPSGVALGFSDMES
jgi:hypothetical protein